MSRTIESVVRIASTPGQAKVFVALLQAAGIPARVDGDLLADEFATSRAMLNMIGTRVMVPTASLAAAEEALHPVAIEHDDLVQQALAEPVEASAASGLHLPPARPFAWFVLLFWAVCLGVPIVLALA